MSRLQLGRAALNLAVQHGLAALAARARRPTWHRPAKVTFEISTVCNLRCVHCDFWQGRRRPDALSLEEWLGLLRTLRRWAGPFALGFRSGEPLLSPMIFPILKGASSLGVLTNFVSHGALIDERMAERIRASGLNVLVLSLDGFRPETHDASRGVPGTHAKVLRAVRLLKAGPGAPLLKLNTIVAGHNLGELEEIVRWAASQGLAGVNFQALRAFGGDWRSLWPKDLSEVRRTLDRLIALKREGYPVLNPEPQLEFMKRYFADPAASYPGLTCGTYTQLNVRYDGEAYCCAYKSSIGNLRDRSPEAVWGSVESRERMREILGCKKDCILLNCNFKPGLLTRAGEFARHLRR